MKKLLILLLSLMLLAVPALADDDYEGGDPPLAPDLELKGNATTGYSWLYEVEDPSILTVTDNGFVPDEGTEGMTGAGGIFTFRLDGLKVGFTTVTFRYARSWETEEAPLCTISYTVDVDDDGDATIYNCRVNPGL